MWRLKPLQVSRVSSVYSKGRTTTIPRCIISSRDFSASSNNSASEPVDSFLQQSSTNTEWVNGIQSSVAEATSNATCIDGSVALAELGYAPSELAMWYLDSVHSVLGCPWWISILASTAILRVALMPLIVRSRRHGERMKVAKPEMDALQKTRIQTAEEVSEYRDKMRAICEKHQFKPLAAVSGPFMQLPIFISMFFALRDGPTRLPSMGEGWKTGGDFWFENLIEADPTMILPALNSASMVLAMGMSKDELPPSMRSTMLWAAIPLTGMTFYICSGMSAGLNLYWVGSNILMVSQTALFKIPAVRNYICPELAPPVIQYAPSPAVGVSTSNFKQIVQQEKKKFQEARLNAAPSRKKIKKNKRKK